MMSRKVQSVDDEYPYSLGASDILDPKFEPKIVDNDFLMFSVAYWLDLTVLKYGRVVGVGDRGHEL